MNTLTCQWCGQSFRQPSKMGTVPKFCSDSHRQAAYRHRHGFRRGDADRAVLDAAEQQEIDHRRWTKMGKPELIYCSDPVCIAVRARREARPRDPVCWDNQRTGECENPEHDHGAA